VRRSLGAVRAQRLDRARKGRPKGGEENLADHSLDEQLNLLFENILLWLLATGFLSFGQGPAKLAWMFSVERHLQPFRNGSRFQRVKNRHAKPSRRLQKGC